MQFWVLDLRNDRKWLLLTKMVSEIWKMERLLGVVVVATIAKDLKCKVSKMVGEEVYMLV